MRSVPGWSGRVADGLTEVENASVLDVVVTQGTTVLELLALEDQNLIMRRSAV